MTIKRAPRPQTNFTILANTILRDDRLSFRARGILTSILSRPDNWRTSADSLANESIEGRGAILTALKELEEHGYLQRKREQNHLGQWISESLIFDSPQTPKSRKPTSAEPTSENWTVLEELYTKEPEQEEIPQSGINASNVVARYVDAYTDSYNEKPPARSIGRMAKDARQLLSEGLDAEVLLFAATDCATNGHVNLASAYTWIKAEPTRNQKKASPAEGWLGLLDQEFTAGELTQ